MQVERWALAALLCGGLLQARAADAPAPLDPEFLEYLSSFGEQESMWERWLDAPQPDDELEDLPAPDEAQKELSHE